MPILLYTYYNLEFEIESQYTKAAEAYFTRLVAQYSTKHAREFFGIVEKLKVIRLFPYITKIITSNLDVEVEIDNFGAKAAEELNTRLVARTSILTPFIY